MGWVLMTLRQRELQSDISDKQMKLLQMSRELRKLSSFSGSIADGKITPDEITSLGTDLFGDALDFMGYSTEAAAQVAQEQTDYYANAYESLTQDQYYNSGYGAEAALYKDENGNLNTDEIYNKFLDEALKDYAEEVLAPMINEKEKALEQEKTELETLIEQEEQELESIKDSKSQAIQNSTIKLS